MNLVIVIAFLLLNGTYDISGSSGIGTGQSNSSASLQELLIQDGKFTVSGKGGFSAIGTGKVEGDEVTNFLHCLQIDNGTFSCTGEAPSGAIGTVLSSKEGNESHQFNYCE
jgi:hypothetical protein